MNVRPFSALGTGKYGKQELYDKKTLRVWQAYLPEIVDRVLHNRGDVSRTSREKVQKVLDEIDYHPNMFAIGLAAKKRYHIICIIPYYIEHDYWSSVAQGIERAAQELRPFNVGIDYVFYNHADKTSYEKACALLQAEPVDAVLIAPNFQYETLRLTSYLKAKKCHMLSLTSTWNRPTHYVISVRIPKSADISPPRY